MKEILMMRGARKLVDKCAKVQTGENVLIVTDPERISIANMLAAALVERNIEPVINVMLPREMDGQEPHYLVAASMLEADVIFLPVSVSIAHSTACRNAMGKGARVLSMSAFIEELMYKGGIHADFEKQKVVCDRFGQYFTDSTEVRIVSEAGTDFTASIKDRHGNSHACIVENPGDLSSVPNIEANVSPVEGTAQGRVVVDGSIPNFGIGLVSEPLILTIKDGFITKIEGGREAEYLRLLLKGVGDQSVFNIAQIAIGLNPEIKRLTGVMENDHGAYGRMHIGIGTSNQLGGDVKAPIHFDVVMEKPTLYFDGKIVLDNHEIKG